jgi:benzoate membrane transport protein
MVTGLLIMLAALWSPLARFIQAIPKAIANAMLAGILFKLCLAPFVALKAMPVVAGAVLLVWVIMLKVSRLFAVPAAIAVAIGVIIWTGGFKPDGGALVPHLALVMPVFTWDALISIALPLFIVTMASQNITGLAVLSTFHYHPDPKQGLLATGAVSALTAPLGAATVNYSAITAAMCAGPEAHPDPARRYVAAVVAGAFYAAFAGFAALATTFVVGSSPLLIEAVAGLALIGSFAAATSASLAVEEDRLPAMATLLVTASGLSIFGIGPAFWGLVIGWGLFVFLKPQKKN